MRCPSCSTENVAGRKFCAECGSRLSAGCPSCGAANDPGAKFCGECGTALAESRERGIDEPDAETVAPAATERRVVSILFVDLVGFTGLTEGRDAEQVRDLQDRYFSTARTVIERYGGTVEKFIGDAVMAMWGAPTAFEDDPERAVRAALDVVDAVGAIRVDDAGPPGEEAVPRLVARAAVMTGDAAINVGATDQGLVSGDLVNTASRLQGVAPSGAVLIDEATHRATQAGIAAEPLGEQDLRGRAAPVPAWHALRTLAMRGGRGRSDRLEPPFVGRDAELRLLKDLLHAADDERRARLVSITGIAGIGKSRLAWELLKYIDGLAGDVYWHQGRSPAYGEGITFWALAEMVRGRAQIAESDDDFTARTRVDELLADHIVDEDERRRLRPALSTLLGLEGDPGARARCRLRRLAPPLRADRRTWARGHGLRGPPVGRHRADRVHRVDPGVEPEPSDPGGHPGPARAARPAADLGRPTAQLHRAPPRAALGRGDDPDARRRRPGPAALVHPADRRAGRRRPAVRGRDDPDAHRRRASGTRGGTVSGRGRDRPTRRPRFAPGAHRRPDRQPGESRSRPRAGRRGPRPELHPGGAGGSDRSADRDASCHASGLSSSGRSWPSTTTRPHRSAASTSSSRGSSARSPTRRWPKRERRTRHLAAARYFESLEGEDLAGVLASHYLDAHAGHAGGRRGGRAGDPGQDRAARRGRAGDRARLGRPGARLPRTGAVGDDRSRQSAPRPGRPPRAPPSGPPASMRPSTTADPRSSTPPRGMTRPAWPGRPSSSRSRSTRSGRRTTRSRLPRPPWRAALPTRPIRTSSPSSPRTPGSS